MRISRFSMITACSIAAVVTVGLVTNCGKKSDDDDSPAGETAAEALNALAVAYPSGLSVSVFPQTGTSASLAGEEKAASIKERREEANKLLKGEADSCLPPAFNRGASINLDRETCYEFDQDMLYGSTNWSNQVKGTKNGKNTAGEACLASFARAKVQDVENILDRSLGLVQGMLCQRKKAGGNTDVPAVGAEVNLAEDLKGAMKEKAKVITAATMKRINDAEGRPMFRINIVIETSDNVTREINILHSPKGTQDNSEFKGKLWTKVTGQTFVGAPSSGPSDNYLSITYSKAGDQLQAELLRGRIAADISAAAFANGVVDLNVGTAADGSHTNGGVNNANNNINAITMIGFNVNTKDNTGTTAYWQNPGGNYNENARGMIFSLAKSGDKLAGCGSSGAASVADFATGLSIRKSKKTGDAMQVKGYFHPFFNNNVGAGACASTPTTGTDTDGDYLTCERNSQTARWYKTAGTEASKDAFANNQIGSLFTRQCVVQNTTAGVYAIDVDQTNNDTAGYDLVDFATDPTKSIAAPDLSGLSGIAAWPVN